MFKEVQTIIDRVPGEDENQASTPPTVNPDTPPNETNPLSDNSPPSAADLYAEIAKMRSENARLSAAMANAEKMMLSLQKENDSIRAKLEGQSGPIVTDPMEASEAEDEHQTEGETPIPPSNKRHQSDAPNTYA